MVKLAFASLREVDTATGECAKLNCNTGSYTLHRHHRRHQAIWLGIWKSRRNGEVKFNAHIKRYHSFDPKDWSRLCDSHHAEIHLIYDIIIRIDQGKIQRNLSQYSWAQAEKLMNKLEAVCVAWLEKETPGSSSDALTALRKSRRKVTRRQTRGDRDG